MSQTKKKPGDIVKYTEPTGTQVEAKITKVNADSVDLEYEDDTGHTKKATSISEGTGNNKWISP